VELAIRPSDGAGGPYAKLVIRPRGTPLREISIDLMLVQLGRVVTGRATIVSQVRFHWRKV
jgi:hypothetical protein